MLTFFHTPNTRSAGIQWLLAELGVPHETRIVDINAEGGAPSEYRAIQAHGKVPAIVHDGVTVTERAAIAIYLADAFPEAGLAPAIGDPRRGPYLSWLTYVDAVLDPALSARLNDWQYVPRSVAFGTFDDALAHTERSLSAGSYIVGETFTAADVALGILMYWGLNVIRAIPDKPVFRAYFDRVSRRTAFQRMIGGAGTAGR